MMRKIGVGLAAVGLLGAAQWVAPSVSAQSTSSGGQAPLTASQAKALSTNVTKRVIVVFKDQVGQDPASRAHVSARRSVESRVQSFVLNELGQTKSRRVHSYTTINAIAATVSPGEEARLAADPAVAEVVPDQLIQLAQPETATATSAAGRTPIPGTCSSNPAQPQLAPGLVPHPRSDRHPNAKTAQSLGIDGSGVTVAYIADGVDTTNPDFMRDGNSVFTQEGLHRLRTAAPTGGEEAFIDSSSIAAQGNQVYNISNYSALPLNKPCYIRVKGSPPEPTWWASSPSPGTPVSTRPSSRRSTTR